MVPDTRPSSRPILTPQELCTQLSISYRTYSRLVRAGMPHVLVLTNRRYDLAHVMAWLRERAQAPVAKKKRPHLFAPADDQLVRHLSPEELRAPFWEGVRNGILLLLPFYLLVAWLASLFLPETG